MPLFNYAPKERLLIAIKSEVMHRPASKLILCAVRIYNGVNACVIIALVKLL